VTDTASVSVMLTSKPTLAVSITESDGSTTVSEGSSDSYTVVLDTAPSDSVQITVSSDDEEQATVDKATLTFTASNWDDPQTVTVTGVDDDVDDGDSTVTISHSASGGGYDGVSIASVDVTVTDDDSAGVSVSKSSLTLSEPSSTGTYSITLESEPTADVEITVTSGDTSEATVSPATLTFTASDWDTPQDVTVTAQDDDVDDGDQTVTISHEATSSDNGYDGASINDVTVTVQDDDGPGFTILQSDGSTDVSEDGSQDTYTVVLTSQPTAEVTISISSGDEGEATVSPSTLTFTTGNWDTPQTVTVTGVDDTNIDGTQTVTITHTASSADSAYNTLPAKEVTVTVADDDSAGDPGDPNDTTPPAAPIFTSPALTDSPTPTIAGTAEAGVTITVVIDLGGGASVTYTTPAGPDGTWSIDLANDNPTDGALPEGGLSDGTYQVTVTATNDTGSASTSHSLTVQTGTLAAGTTLYLPLIAR
jgi:hypothetical protein